MNAITPHRQTGIAPVLQPQTFDQLVRFAEMAATTDLMPRDYKGKPGNIMIAVQMGSELGLSPMQALQNIAVVNGRPTVYGDALLGLVRRDPRCLDVQEAVEGDGDNRTAVCTVQRKGSSPVVSRFSVGDAKKAGLWGKQGPWQQYPDRMLAMRARSFACRDAFPDVLRGLISAEEAQDIPPDNFQGTTINATPVAAAAEYVRPAPVRQTTAPKTTSEYLGDAIPDFDAPPAGADDANAIIERMEAAETLEDLESISAAARKDVEALPRSLRHLVITAFKAAKHGFELQTGAVA